MKNTYLLCFFLFQIQSFTQIKVDSILYEYALPAPKTTDVKYLAQYLRSGISNFKEKIVVTFFYWIAQNTGYDGDLMN